jgi:hypothetical protein
MSARLAANLRRLNNDLTREGLSYSRRRADLRIYRLLAIRTMAEATLCFDDIVANDRSLSMWDNYVERIVKAGTTVHLHRCLVEVAGWFDMLSDWQENPPAAANDR